MTILVLCLSQAKVIEGLSSNDKNKVKYSLQKADELLGGSRLKEGGEIIDSLSYVKFDRTVINPNALKNDEKEQKNITPDAFMKQVETDAANRAENRRQNKVVSDRYMKEGNKAFREKDYDKALSCYNKAIDVLKDTSILYLNRALTFLKLGLCQRALKDTETALFLRPMSLKGFLYKAEALYRIGEYKNSEQTIQEACKAHPDKVKLIKDTEDKWINADIYEEEKHSLNQ